jgi:hypothetical protein
MDWLLFYAAAHEKTAYVVFCAVFFISVWRLSKVSEKYAEHGRIGMALFYKASLSFMYMAGFLASAMYMPIWQFYLIGTAKWIKRSIQWDETGIFTGMGIGVVSFLIVLGISKYDLAEIIVGMVGSIV